MKKKALTRKFLTRSGPVDDAFRKLSPAQKRVAVATDALRWLKSGVITATCGSYIRPTRNIKDRDLDEPVVSPRGVAAFGHAQCAVCAKGALFLTTIMRTNERTTETALLSSSSPMMSHKVCNEERVFSRRAFDVIEDIFEDRGWNFTARMRWNRYPKFTRMPTAYGAEIDHSRSTENQDLRLKAILVNILIHKGNFKPRSVPSLAKVKEWLAKV